MINVGDRVVCVNTNPLRGQGDYVRAMLSLLSVGKIYRVREVRQSFSLRLLRRVQCIRVDGIEIPETDSGYMDWRFKKLRASDSEFTEMMYLMKRKKNETRIDA